MLLKNNVPRLITINAEPMKNGKRGKAYQIKPGNHPAVDVPDEVCKGNKFVESLIKDKSLLVITESAEVEETEPTDDGDERDLLLAEAMDLDLTIKDSWAISTLKRKIAEARKAAEAE